MIFVAIIVLLYSTLITYLIIGFDKVLVFENNKNTTSQSFSILIPFRDEAANITTLAKSLQELHYPTTQFEVIWINDHSTDNSVPLLTEFIIKNSNWKLLDNQRKSYSPKKDAINTAIKKAKYNWIITTDADCKVPKNWLQSFCGFILSCTEKSQNINMIAAPVAYKTDNGFLQNFQTIDFLSLIGSTIGGFGIGKPFMCNGANLCYNKKAFFIVNGFKGNDNIASGDDVFLLEKMRKKFPKSIYYLKTKEALVLTNAEITFKGLINQRIRWASKTSSTNNWFGKGVGTIVFLMNFISLYFLIFGFWFTSYKKWILFILLLKFIIDFILIRKTSRFLNQKFKLQLYPFSAVFYPFFVVFVVFLSIFKHFEWKGRIFKK